MLVVDEMGVPVGIGTTGVGREVRDGDLFEGCAEAKAWCTELR